MPTRRSSRLFLAAGQKLSRWVGWNREADLLYVRGLDGFLTRRKAELIYDAVRGLQGPGAVAEVGSWKGKSTVALSLALQRAGRKGPIYAIDHHEGSEEHREIVASEGSTWPTFLATIEAAGIADLVHPLRMGSLESARWLSEHGIKLRFLFLDGAHDEQSVRADLEAFIPLMLPGAYIALDDAETGGPHPGVHRAYRTVLEPLCEEVAWGGAVLLVRLRGS
ncbi:MAG: class I SAM-dependent methyltransferase [Deltaproteobacteria bacterium]|nr:class I SAM-dependent methyltransferase [Deltaproteobacteria bacterium]MBW2412966.1 class I SAM-dependent methyltransferase [Deltaproteobacteria bacterium]